MGYGDEIINTFVIDQMGRHYPDKKIVMSSETMFPGLKTWSRAAKSIYLNNPYLIQPKTPEAKDLDKNDLIFFPDWPGKRRLRTHKKGKLIRNDKEIYENELFDWFVRKHYLPDPEGPFSFKANPGVFYFSEEEKAKIEKLKQRYSDHVLVHPLCSSACYGCKDWGIERWNNFIDLASDKSKLIQFSFCPPERSFKEKGVEQYDVNSFRESLLLIAAVKMGVTTEGGVSHSLAALHKPAVILFGGRVHPDHLGYNFHCNIYVDHQPDRAISPVSPCEIRCKRDRPPCPHCEVCWEATSPDLVYGCLENFDNNKKNIILKPN